MKTLRFNPIITLCLILAGVTACYWGVLRNGYVWDDRISFLDYPQLMSWDGLKQALSNPGLFFPANYYRPLTTLHIFIELKIGGREPWVLHAVSLLIHLANTGLVFWLGRRLVVRFSPLIGDGGRAIPWIAAALYGFHPALTEPVAWIAARSDLTVTFFVLACMVLSIGQGTALRLPLLAFVFFCAGLSKESAVVLPILLVLIDGFEVRYVRVPLKEVVRERYSVYGAIFLGGVGVLAVRYLGLGYLITSGDSPPATGSAIQHALLVGQALYAYLRAALVPFDTINPFHMTAIPVVVTDPVPWIQALTATAALAGFIHAWRRCSLWGLLGLLYVAALLPVLQIRPLPLSGNLYHERYMTLPLAFMALGVALLVVKGARGPSFSGRTAWAAWIGVGCWIALAIANVLVTVPLWRTDFVLWTWVLERNPESFIAKHNLAGAYLSAGEYEKASELNRDLLRRYPGHYLPLMNLGLQAIRENRLKDAIAFTEQAIRSPYGIEKSYYALALGNLGFAEAGRGNLDLAETLLSEAIRIAPGFVEVVSNLSLVQRLKGNAVGADANWTLALSYVPPKERAAFAARAERNLVFFRDALGRSAQSSNRQ